MSRFTSARRSRWRRARPAGLIPPLPPPRTGAPSPAEGGAGLGPGAAGGRTPRPPLEDGPPALAPGRSSTVVATTTPAEGAAQVGRPAADVGRRRAEPRPSVDAPAAIPPPPPASSSRVRVLHSASELDDARARAAEQMRRIAEAMGPTVRRQRRGGGAASDPPASSPDR